MASDTNILPDGHRDIDPPYPSVVLHARLDDEVGYLFYRPTIATQVAAVEHYFMNRGYSVTSSPCESPAEFRSSNPLATLDIMTDTLLRDSLFQYEQFIRRPTSSGCSRVSLIEATLHTPPILLMMSPP